MLLKASFSNTKKFFQRTVKSLKYFLSNGYQRLPKTPPFNPFSCSGGDEKNCSQSHRELNNFYKVEKVEKGEYIKTYQEGKSESKKKRIAREGKLLKEHDQLSTHSKGVRKEKSCLVREKLKELETMDVGNVEHVLDIEEILHYYSRLTCPTYLDIVDTFFMEVYSELFNLQSSATHAMLTTQGRG